MNTLLRWKEPRVRHADSRRIKRSFMRLVLVCLLASLPVIWASHRWAPDATGRISLALALIMAFMFFIFWVHRVFPSWVTVTETGIRRSITTDDEEAWPFKSMRQCTIVDGRADGRGVRMLVIETREGDRDSIAISDSVPLEELVTILSGKGITVSKKTGSSTLRTGA